MILSLVETGIVPGSFYELDAEGGRQRAHYDGLPVEFIAESISTLGASTLGAQTFDGFRTLHLMNPYDDGIGMDEFVDWLIDPAVAGCAIQRVDDYADWLHRFESEPAGAARKAPKSSATHRCCRCCTATRSRNGWSVDR